MGRLPGSDEYSQVWKLHKGILLPELPTLVLDCGRSTENGNKWAFWVDDTTLMIKKFPCNLNIKEGEYLSAMSSSNLLSDDFDQTNDGNVIFETDGTTYTAGWMAQDEGAKTGLGEKKSVNIKARVISGLILFGITGSFNLWMTATHEEKDDFDRQCEEIEEALSDELNWNIYGRNFSAQLVKLQVAPESSNSWKFPNLLEPGQHPDFSGLTHVTFDGGFQSFNKIVRNQNGFINSALSTSTKDLGLSKYYAEIAKRIGYPKPECPHLIRAVNQGRDKFKIPSQRKPAELGSVIKAIKPLFERNFLKHCEEEVPAGCYSITLAGGSMYLFGEYLHRELSENFEVVLAPLPEIAQVVAQSFEAAAKFSSR